MLSTSQRIFASLMNFPDTVPKTTDSMIELAAKDKFVKKSKIFILDAIVMTDMNIICVSSMCSDLRFFDMSTDKCHLRLYIRNFPSPLSTFHYHVRVANNNNDSDKNDEAIDDDEIDEVATLICGDFAGSVLVIDFMSEFRSNFRKGASLRQISYQEMKKVKRNLMRKVFQFCVPICMPLSSVYCFFIKNCSQINFEYIHLLAT
jgi:hypothetical protein